MKDIDTELLIVGAGPFGLGLAAYVQQAGVPHVVVGKPMGFWKAHMPQGMLLRSGCDWSLDPAGVHSIDAYLDEVGRPCGSVLPMSRDFYLGYADWFRRSKGIDSLDVTVTSLSHDDDGFVAVTGDGRRIRSRRVVLAIGFRPFAHVPAELEATLPRDRWDHTCDLVDFRALAGRRVLIVGGRQSAFETAARMREAGVAEIHLSYRHDTPAFTASDWGFVRPVIERMSDDPGWYRRLSPDERQRLDQRYWAEGRLRLEPWLAPRIDHANVHLHPRTRVVAAQAHEDEMTVTLDDGAAFIVDHVALATGYRTDLAKATFLADALRARIDVQEGHPRLDEHFQSSVPGLYVTSLAATRDFGMFLAFTVSVRTQATVIGRHIARQLPSPGSGVAPQAVQ